MIGILRPQANQVSTNLCQCHRLYTPLGPYAKKKFQLHSEKRKQWRRHSDDLERYTVTELDGHHTEAPTDSQQKAAATNVGMQYFCRQKLLVSPTRTLKPNTDGRPIHVNRTLFNRSLSAIVLALNFVGAGGLMISLVPG